MSQKVLRFFLLAIYLSYLILAVVIGSAWISYIFLSSQVGGTELQGWIILASATVIPGCLGIVAITFLSCVKLRKTEQLPLILIFLMAALGSIVAWFVLSIFELNLFKIVIIILAIILVLMISGILASRIESRGGYLSVVRYFTSLFLLALLIGSVFALIRIVTIYNDSVLIPVKERRGVYVPALQRDIKGLDSFIGKDAYTSTIISGAHLIVDSNKIIIQPDGQISGYIYDISQPSKPLALGYKADVSGSLDQRDNKKSFIHNYDPNSFYNPSPVDAYIYRNDGKDTFRYVTCRDVNGVEQHSIAPLFSNGLILDIAVKGDLIFVLTREEGLFIFSQSKIIRIQP